MMLRVGVVLLGVLLGAGAFAQSALPDAAPERVLVVGQRPGPGLWKVSKGEHVLWIFGSYAPLPEKMQWRAHQVDAILAQSQAFLSPPTGTADVGFLQSLSALPFAFGVRNNPNGATLREVLAPDVYARWLPLKKKYLGEDEGIERERPIFVADTLFRSGLKQAGLSNGQDVLRTIEAAVKQHGIATTASNVTLVVGNAVGKLRQFKASTLNDGACFARTLEHLESDIDAMRARANAWAIGDLAVITKLDFGDRQQACDTAVLSSTFLAPPPGTAPLMERMQAAWLANAEAALAANASTFAVLPLRELLDANGSLAALRARGYTVEVPE